MLSWSAIAIKTCLIQAPERPLVQSTVLETAVYVVLVALKRFNKCMVRRASLHDPFPNGTCMVSPLSFCDRVILKWFGSLTQLERLKVMANRNAGTAFSPQPPASTPLLSARCLLGSREVMRKVHHCPQAWRWPASCRDVGWCPS